MFSNVFHIHVFSHAIFLQFICFEKSILFFPHVILSHYSFILHLILSHDSPIFTSDSITWFINLCDIFYFIGLFSEYDSFNSFNRSLHTIPSHDSIILMRFPQTIHFTRYVFDKIVFFSYMILSRDLFVISYTLTGINH